MTPNDVDLAVEVPSTSGRASHPRPANADDAAPSGGYTAYVRDLGDGRHALDCMVEGVHCGGCVNRIERVFQGTDDVEKARVNLSTRRLALVWSGAAERADALCGAVTALGYRLVPYDPSRLTDEDRREEKELLRAMAVAGFAAANVMLLSVSVWAGYFEDMGPATRSLLHWFSALVACPAIIYAGRPFFRSAWTALRHRRTNMDVPISLGVILAGAMSLHETIVGGIHTYFDSAVTLLFFLLVGRFLDRRARGRAHSAGTRLLALRASSVTVLRDDGTRIFRRPEDVATDERLLVGTGERIGVDGTILTGTTEIDTSLITGEAIPKASGPGDHVFAGTINGTAPITIEATGTGDDTLLAEIARLMEAAEQRRSRYVELADRVARHYAPVVHGLALATLVGWIAIMSVPWQTALLHAVAVLIITCPCALGLAVPVVQVVASDRLMRRGVLLKSASALERLAQIDHVVFDKTGTLTDGAPELVPVPAQHRAALNYAAGLAATSKHPLARALASAAPDAIVVEGVDEVPGMGLRVDTEDGEVRLGSRAWCGVTNRNSTGTDADSPEGPELWYRAPGQEPVRFAFRERLRPDADEVVRWLRDRGIGIEILSGDRADSVALVANTLSVTDWRGGVTPSEKCARLEELSRSGRRVLMIGDGLNDAAALAAAHVSLSPSTAADISQTAADAVFQGASLRPVIETTAVADRAAGLVRQNFMLAFGYNVFTIPLAVAGLVTPLIAALAMSGSSIVVVCNALRLSRNKRS